MKIICNIHGNISFDRDIKNVRNLKLYYSIRYKKDVGSFRIFKNNKLIKRGVLKEDDNIYIFNLKLARFSSFDTYDFIIKEIKQSFTKSDVNDIKRLEPKLYKKVMLWLLKFNSPKLVKLCSWRMILNLTLDDSTFVNHVHKLVQKYMIDDKESVIWYIEKYIELIEKKYLNDEISSDYFNLNSIVTTIFKKNIIRKSVIRSLIDKLSNKYYNYYDSNIKPWCEFLTHLTDNNEEEIPNLKIKNTLNLSLLIKNFRKCNIILYKHDKMKKLENEIYIYIKQIAIEIYNYVLLLQKWDDLYVEKYIHFNKHIVLWYNLLKLLFSLLSTPYCASKYSYSGICIKSVLNYVLQQDSSVIEFSEELFYLPSWFSYSSKRLCINYQINTLPLTTSVYLSVLRSEPLKTPNTILNMMRQSNLIINVRFINEEGNGDGLLREWVYLCFDYYLDDKNKLFEKLPNGSYMITPKVYNIKENEVYYKVLGNLLFICILYSIKLPFQLSSLFYLHLNNTYFSPTRKHLQQLDSVVSDSLFNLMSYSEEEIENADIYFESCIPSYNGFDSVIVQLQENGSNKQVKDTNKKNFINLILQERIVSQYQDMMLLIKKQFNKIYRNVKGFELLSSRELKLWIEGNPVIDVKDWKIYCSYKNWTEHIPGDNKICNFFWDIVEEENNAWRMKLFKFVTALKCIPKEGFVALKYPFTISKGEDYKLPSANTCYCMLKLSSHYRDKNQLKIELDIAMENSVFAIS